MVTPVDSFLKYGSDVADTEETTFAVWARYGEGERKVMFTFATEDDANVYLGTLATGVFVNRPDEAGVSKVTKSLVFTCRSWTDLSDGCSSARESKMS